MEKFFEKFILRDILSFVFPGAIVLSAMINIFDPVLGCTLFYYLKSGRFGLIPSIVAVGLVLTSYLLGVVVNFVRDQFSFRFLYPKQQGSYSNNVKDWYPRYIRFLRNASDAERDRVNRFSELFHLTGNAALALGVSGLIMLPNNVKIIYTTQQIAIWPVIIFVISILLCVSHCNEFQNFHDFIAASNGSNDGKLLSNPQGEEIYVCRVQKRNDFP